MESQVLDRLRFGKQGGIRMNGNIKALVKRAAAALLIISLVLLVMSVDVQAKKNKTSGTHYGTKWNYDQKTKTLTLSCKGRMNDDYLDPHKVGWPWTYYDCTDNAEKVVFKDGITYICKYCLYM